MKKKYLSIFAALLIISMLAACSGQGDPTTATTAPMASEKTTEATKGEESETAVENSDSATKTDTSDSIYPIETDEVLTIWMELNGNLTTTVTSMSETEQAKYMEELTGVRVEYQHPTIDQGREQFNLLLSAGELPDLIQYDWAKFSGGPEKAIADGYILKLNDLIDEYAPNLKNVLAERPVLDKEIRTDLGSYYAFPFVRGDSLNMVYHGPIIRSDWLEDLNLDVPVTIDDWYNTLKAFKESYNAVFSFSGKLETGNNAAFLYGIPSAPFNVVAGFYMQDGKVVYGPSQDAFQDYLDEMVKWVSEGLVDPNIGNLDSAAQQAGVLNGEIGLTNGNAGGQLGTWLKAIPEDSPIKLQGIPYPVMNEGDIPFIGQKDFEYSSGHGWAISTSCKNPELAVKYLDFGYSKEGDLLFNFGKEGETYDLVGEIPTYSEQITENPDGKTLAEALAFYTRANYGGPFVQSKHYVHQYNVFPEQMEAIETWMKTDAAKSLVPNITFTEEEMQTVATIKTDLDTYVDEYIAKIYTGKADASDFEDFRAQLESFGLSELQQIYNTALERFQTR